MASEEFLEILKRQFHDELLEAAHECHCDHGKVCDYERLNDKVEKIYRAALLEGIDRNIFAEWTHGAIPDHFEHLPFFARAAA